MTHHQGNTNKTTYLILVGLLLSGKQNISIENVEKREPLCTFGSHYGKQYGGSSECKNRAISLAIPPLGRCPKEN